MPESSAHQIAANWLADYFDCFDKHPEVKDLVSLQIL